MYLLSGCVIVLAILLAWLLPDIDPVKEKRELFIGIDMGEEGGDKSIKVTGHKEGDKIIIDKIEEI